MPRKTYPLCTLERKLGEPQWLREETFVPAGNRTVVGQLWSVNRHNCQQTLKCSEFFYINEQILEMYL